MKRFLLIILFVLLIFCFCSCDSCSSSHRKIVFSDGTEICFSGGCSIYDTYIAYDSYTGLVKSGYRQYVSIDGRSFQIIECSCDALEE